MLGCELGELVSITSDLREQCLLALECQASKVFASLLYCLLSLLLQVICLGLYLNLEHFDVLLVLNNSYQALAKLLELLHLLGIAIIEHLGGVLCLLQSILSLHTTYQF